MPLSWRVPGCPCRRWALCPWPPRLDISGPGPGTSGGGESWPLPRARAAADTVVKHGVCWGPARPKSLKCIWLGKRGRVFTSAVAWCTQSSEALNAKRVHFSASGSSKTCPFMAGGGGSRRGGPRRGTPTPAGWLINGGHPRDTLGADRGDLLSAQAIGTCGGKLCGRMR